LPRWNKENLEKQILLNGRETTIKKKIITLKGEFQNDVRHELREASKRLSAVINFPSTIKTGTIIIFILRDDSPEMINSSSFQKDLQRNWRNTSCLIPDE